MNEMSDPLDTLARYAPTSNSICAEWSPEHSLDVLADIIGNNCAAGAAVSPGHNVGLHFVPARAGSRRRRWASAVPLAASVAVLAVAAGVIVAVLSSGRSGSHDAAGGLGPAFNPPAGLPNTSLSSTQYSYRVDQQIDLDANGKPKQHSQNALLDRNYVSPNGDIVSFRTGSQQGCFTFAHSGKPSFQEPTRSFFQSLPTDVGALNSYLRGHVAGSTSRNEAVFVAVGDALRTADGLATPRLRGALFAVLSRTPGVVVHENDQDYLGRPAIRADFVDQRNRPGEIQSLYFDPTRFQLLEERSGSNSQPQTYNGPSGPYEAQPPPGDTPQELTGAAYVDVMTSETIVDKLPTIPPNCNH
jgi:hypothetical protein